VEDVTTVEEFAADGGFVEDGLGTFDWSPNEEFIAAAEADDAPVGAVGLFAGKKKNLEKKSDSTR
jgi:hypothetical protein